jgi:malate dehydrogenase (oxaloacetate-decarboxylating)
VFFGAGAAGAGCALAVRTALCETGMSVAEASRRVVALDSKGLIVADRPGLDDIKRQIAAPSDLVAGWPASPGHAFSLSDVVRAFRPTALVGLSGQPGSFSEPIVRQLLASCPRPTILALSNPTSKIEATPEDLLRWTNGAAIVGTGSPFDPVRIDGRTFTIGQGNNVLIFPGVGLGATARWSTSTPPHRRRRIRSSHRCNGFTTSRVSWHSRWHENSSGWAPRQRHPMATSSAASWQ